MKINSIGFYNLNCTPKSTFQSTDAPRFNAGMHTSPIRRAISVDQVSFTGMPIPFFLKNIRGFHCPCCGVEMPMVDDIIAKLTDANLSGDCKTAVKALSYFEGNMHKVEKGCFDILKAVSEKKPSRTLQGILASVRPEYFEKLKLTQFKIIDQLDEVGKGLSADSARRLKVITSTAKNCITCEGNYDSFKRKPMLDQIFKLKRQVQEKEIADQLYKIVQTLPASGDDLNAFVVKYSQRSSREIGQRLVSPSTGTVEHIKPRSLGGASDDVNYMLECAGCNNPRGNQIFSDFVADNPQMIHNIPVGTDMGGLSTEEWVKIHPEHKGNIQKHFDEVIDKINDGTIEGHDWYPALVAKTIEKESSGSVVLDLSRLKTTIKSAPDTKPLVKKYNHPKSLASVKNSLAEKNKSQESANPFRPTLALKNNLEVDKAQVVKKEKPKKSVSISENKPPVENDDVPINIFKSRRNSDKTKRG